MMIKFVLDGQEVEAKADELLIDLLLRDECKVPSVCYHPQLGPIQTCDTCMVEVDGKLVRACATLAAGMQVQTKSARADAAQREAFDRILEQPPALLHGLRQQQRQLHRAQHDEAARGRASGDSLHSRSPTRSTHESVLPLRSRPVHSLRALRRGLPERAGERDAVHPLGGSASARAVGWRRADRRIELRLLRPLRHRLPVQCADGKVDARPGRLLHRPAASGAGRHDRRGQGHRAGDGLSADPASLRSRSGDARIAHQQDQDGLHLLRRGLQLRYLDRRTGTS